MKKIIFLILFGFAQWSLALSADALKCISDVRAAKDIFKMSKDYKTNDHVEKLFIGLCTYSNSKGAQKCYRDAMKMDSVLKQTKNVTDIFGIEAKVSRLCSNSHLPTDASDAQQLNSIGCYLETMRDSEMLSAIKNYKNAVAVESDAISLCISSNAKGATTCFKEGLKHKDDVLGSHASLQELSAFEETLIVACRGSHL